MTTKKTGTAPAPADDTLRVNEKKWTKTLMDAGWTAVPSVIIEKQKALGLDAIDMNILLHLAMYWWTPDNKPHPSVDTIAEAVQVKRRTIQRRLKRLDAAGFIKREERRVKGKGSNTNLYHFDGLINEATPYAKEKIAEKLAAIEAKKAKVASKAKPKLQLVKDDGDEVDK